MLHPYLQLSLTTGLGPILIGRLIEAAGSAERAVTLSRKDLQYIEGIGQARARAIHESLQSAAADAELQIRKASELGAKLICREDSEYPELLRPLNDAPAVLYLQGSLEPRDLQSLAIVGSRRCTHYGREQADRFASLLAGAGCTVISGGARGIDSAAHRGALRHPQGRTLAILGSGLDVPYPPENTSLFSQVAQRGAVITEMPFGSPPNAENFPRRNRIVSGLARGVLVIEADLRSGALITARLANEDHGRPVFALPGRVDSPMSRGPHQLIRDGAILVSSIEEILLSLDPLPDNVARSPDSDDRNENDGSAPPDANGQIGVASSSLLATLNDTQSLILREIAQDAAAADILIERTGLPAATVLQELTFLTLKGMIRRIDGQTYGVARGR